ncbi:hypothetical protein CVT23_03530 [Minwuia thermotolerans]|uniref:PAS domain-containing protein n=2 Tax=Minwuia thermotolerans TaxID=2056226 RepID=A0A2M9G5F0_9PROT|nr:hypothetical protein CVT23_03530 [Minwuia thermotolerans]
MQAGLLSSARNRVRRGKPAMFEDALATAVAGGDQLGLNRLFADEGLEPPLITWSPATNELPAAPLRFLNDYWRGLPKTGGLPQARAVDPLAMKPALGYIMLLDVLDGGADFRYRVYGSRIAQHSGFDMTGKKTSEIGSSNYVSVFFLCMYRAAMIRREAVYTRHNPAAHVSVRTWDRLLLPLAGDEGLVQRILAGNVAGDWRPVFAAG